MRTSSYISDAEDDARDCAENFLDEIVEQYVDKGRVSDDLLNDYPGGDSYHHENHTDKYYNLEEAARVLDELSEFEETDSGLWDSLSPKEAVGVMAAFTYANAVYAKWADLIEEINDDPDLEEIAAKYEDEEDFSDRIKKRIEEIIG